MGDEALVPAALDLSGLATFLEQLSDFDQAMNEVVTQSCVLRGGALLLKLPIAINAGGVQSDQVNTFLCLWEEGL